MKKHLKRKIHVKKRYSGNRGRFFAALILFGGLLLTVAALLNPQNLRQFAQYSTPPLYGCLQMGASNAQNCGSRMGQSGAVQFSLYGRPFDSNNQEVYYGDTLTASSSYSNTGDQPISIKAMGIAGGSLSQYYVADFSPVQGPATIKPNTTSDIKAATHLFNGPDPDGDWIFGVGVTDNTGQELPIATSTHIKVNASCTALRVNPLTDKDKTDIKSYCASNPTSDLCTSKEYCQIFKGGTCNQPDLSSPVSGQQCDNSVVLVKAEQDILEELCSTYPDAPACKSFCSRAMNSTICPVTFVDQSGNSLSAIPNQSGPRAVAGAEIAQAATDDSASTDSTAADLGSGAADAASDTSASDTPDTPDPAPADTSSDSTTSDGLVGAGVGGAVISSSKIDDLNAKVDDGSTSSSGDSSGGDSGTTASDLGSGAGDAASNVSSPSTGDTSGDGSTSSSDNADSSDGSSNAGGSGNGGVIGAGPGMAVVPASKFTAIIDETKKPKDGNQAVPGKAAVYNVAPATNTVDGQNYSLGGYTETDYPDGTTKIDTGTETDVYSVDPHTGQVVINKFPDTDKQTVNLNVGVQPGVADSQSTDPTKGLKTENISIDVGDDSDNSFTTSGSQTGGSSTTSGNGSGGSKSSKVSKGGKGSKSSSSSSSKSKSKSKSSSKSSSTSSSGSGGSGSSSSSSSSSSQNSGSNGNSGTSSSGSSSSSSSTSSKNSGSSSSSGSSKSGNGCSVSGNAGSNGIQTCGNNVGSGTGSGKIWSYVTSKKNSLGQPCSMLAQITGANGQCSLTTSGGTPPTGGLSGGLGTPLAVAPPTYTSLFADLLKNVGGGVPNTLPTPSLPGTGVQLGSSPLSPSSYNIKALQQGKPNDGLTCPATATRIFSPSMGHDICASNTAHPQCAANQIWGSIAQKCVNYCNAGQHADTTGKCVAN